MTSQSAFSRHVPSIRHLLVCLVAATAITQCSASWMTLVGSSVLSAVALAGGIGAGLALTAFVLWSTDPWLVSVHRLRFGVPVVLILTAFGAWISPRLLQATLDAGVATFFSTTTFRVCLSLVFPSCVIAVLSSLAMTPVIWSGRDAGRDWRDTLLMLFVVCPMACVQAFGDLPMSWTVTALCAVSALVWLLTVPVRLNSHEERVFPAKKRLSVSGWSSVAQLMCSAYLGVVVIGGFAYLTPPSFLQLLLSMSIAAGALAVFRLVFGKSLILTSGTVCGGLLLVAGLPACFPLLTELNLTLNLHVTSAALLIVLRSAECSLWLFATFVPWLVCSSDEERNSSALPHVAAMFAGIFCGLVVTSTAVWSAGLLMGIVFQCLIVLPVVLRVRGPQFVSGWVRVSLQAACLAFPVGLTLLVHPDTAGSSRLLFSERTLAALQRDVDTDLIAQSDASRLLEGVQTFDGELTVWRRLGDVVEFRLHGVSAGQVSTDTRVTPQPAEDILPAIIGLASHPQPGRVLVLGDETGVALQTCTHFPVQQIVAVRSSRQVTELASAYTWKQDAFPADSDDRVVLKHAPVEMAIRDRSLERFDVVISAPGPVSSMGTAAFWSGEFYESVKNRMASEGVFCQRFRRSDLGPEPLREALATLAGVFEHAGAIQTVPGEILLLATDAESGLIHPDLLNRLQREHVRRELTGAAWDWSQVAVLPLANAGDRLGLFGTQPRPAALSAAKAQVLLRYPLEAARSGNKAEELAIAFSPYQMQIASAIPVGEAHEEAKRRLSGIAQQLEILAGMPDQPWTYRRSLRMEMQRSPRPPLEVIADGKIMKEAHPLDKARQDYFLQLGSALMSAARGETDSLKKVQDLYRFAETGEPLMGHFAHYEIVRLHEMLNHPALNEELIHRLHTVFFTTPSDASVRPVIAAMEQLVEHPELIPDKAERYDQLNSLVQKLIERWEARTAWEPRSAIRVQNDVDQSVRVTNLAVEQMEGLRESAALSNADFLRRRRFINAALISPLRQYKDQVLAHRMKTAPPTATEGEVPNDLPLLVNPASTLNTN